MTSPSFSPLLPIVITIVVVIIVVITCVTMALYLMRLKKSSTTNQTGRGFKTAPFRPQKALSGFSAPEKSCLDHNRYTFLGPHATPPLDDTPSPAPTSDPDDGQHQHQHQEQEHIVRVIFKTCRRSSNSKALTPFAGVTGGHAPAPLSGHHDHKHVTYKFGDY